MKALSLKPLHHPVDITITIPGSKSVTNRALIIAALTKGRVVIKNFLLCDDTQAMITCLKQLGIQLHQKENILEVDGNLSEIKNKTYTLDAQLSGTTLRFLLAAMCMRPGTKILTGKPGLCKRPIKDLVDALRKMGASITYLEEEGFPPIKVTPISHDLKIHEQVSISGKTSSQFISALLMILPMCSGGVIQLKGKLVSVPYIDLTKQIMSDFGVQIIEENNQISVAGHYKPCTYIVEGDYSSAAYFAAIAALTQSTITLKNLDSDSMQPDKKFLSILEEMGNKVTYKKTAITVEGRGVKPISVDMIDCPDQIQTLSVLAAFAKGKTTIGGISTLKIKETDRLTAIVQELKKMGIETQVTKDSLTIHGGKPHGAIIDTYGDHRMAMSFVIAGAKIPGIVIKNPEVVTKTFPTFWTKLAEIGVKSSINSENRKTNIALIGFMCSGKTTIAKILAKKLGFAVEEMDENVRQMAKKSTEGIFQEIGEKGYRELEIQATKEIQNKKNIVISTGGGTIMSKENVDSLQSHSKLIFLDTPFEVLVSRLDPKIPRPLFKNKKQAKSLYDLRLPLYISSADFSILTADKTPEEIATEIIERIHANE